MLLQISTTHSPARDLGFLLGKHPDRLQTFDLSSGVAHVFYPEATDDRTTVALLTDLDTVDLVRGSRGGISQYVNDRPYVSSSYFSVALGRVFRDAMNGRSVERPELAQTTIPLEVTLDTVSAPRESTVREFFEPLGWSVEVTTYPLDPEMDWGDARSMTVRLTGHAKLCDLLSHLYVLLPALDGNKHYFIDDTEIDKLLRRGDEWLPSHPARERITRAYLERRRHLVSKAEAQLAARVTPLDDPDELDDQDDQEHHHVEKPLRLHEVRLDRVTEILAHTGAQSVIDLGCGEGKLLRKLVEHAQFTRIVGVDVVLERLRRAGTRLRLEDGRHGDRVELLQGSLLYPDARLDGFDAAALVEVIEHIELDRLAVATDVLFGSTRPRYVVVTTPNAEYNVLFENLPAGKFRHGDHRFEWTRSEFQTWAEDLGERYGYTATYDDLGPVDDELGAPTQCALFTRTEDS